MSDMKQRDDTTKRPTPDTDDEASVMTLDCDDSCVEIYIKRNGEYVEGDFVLGDFARKLERERDEAREIALNLQNIMGMKV